MTEKTVLLQSVDPARTVAFTGYRPQKIMESVNSRMTKVNQQYDYNTIYLIILKRLHVLIRTLYAEGYDTFLSGMADGFDICGAQAVMELQSELPGLRLIAVPAYLKNITNDTFYHRMYAEVMASAALIYPVSPHYSRDCFDKRNEVLVSNCSTIVCYYDGLKGGTANTITKARRRDLRVVNICLNKIAQTYNHKTLPEYIEAMKNVSIR